MFLAIALFPMLFFSALTFHNYKNSMEATHLEQLENIAAFKAEKIETYFAVLKSQMKITQGLYNIRRNFPTLNKFTQSPSSPEFIAAKKMLDEQLPQLQSIIGLSDIMLINPEDAIVYSSNSIHFPRDFGRPLPDFKRKTFEEGGRGAYISEIFLNNLDGAKPGILLVAPFHGSDGAFVGVLAFEVDAAPIYKIIQDKTGLEETGETILGKKTGNQVEFLNPLRRASEITSRKIIKLGEDVAIPIQEAVQGRNGAGQSIDYRGKKVIAAWRYMPSLDWGMVAKIDTDEVFADVSNLGKQVVIILVIVSILAGAMAFFVAKSLSDPINKLTKGVEIIGSGNLEYEVGTESKDEIGQLSRAFDKMTRDLKTTTASRDELNREIVERKRTEDELVRSNENLEQFAYVASHDLQEPLRMMASYSELLERRYRGKLDNDADDFINYIVDGAKRMQKLINDLLAYSRVGRTGKAAAEFDCNTVIGRVLVSMRAAIEESGAVVTRDNMPTLIAVEVNFIQLFQNLIGNAIKFHGEEPPRIHIGFEKRMNEWLFSVRDNGIGVDPKYKDKIFLIFQRLHGREKYQGTGVGLSICKKIVEAQGGRIWIESEPGKGSVFYFTVPVKI
jgi:signal transduction histidine kinase